MKGKPKPAQSTFAAPFVIDLPQGRKSGLFWGQVRPAAAPGVTIQIRPKGSKTWTDLTKVSQGSDGMWSKRITVKSGASYRYLWQPLPTIFNLAPTPQPSAR